MLFGLGGFVLLLSFVVWAWALIDWFHTDPGQVRVLPKWAWLAVIVLLGPYFGGAFWFLVGRPSGVRLAAVGTASSGFAPRPQRARGPVGPDDDPEFLRTL